MSRIIDNQKMTEYYRGHSRPHAAFWARYRKLSFDQQFPAFIDFFKEVEREVRTGECSLRDAGYAIEPGYYDKAIQADPHGGDMTIACNLAAELAGGIFESREEAQELWGQIVEIMHKYL
jgi:hypothetical protein